MYEVYLINESGTYLIDDMTIGGGDYKLKDWTLTQTCDNDINSFVFEMYPNHEYYSKITLMNTYIYVHETVSTDENGFYGRVIAIKDGMDADGSLYRQVTCESAEAFFKDTVQLYRKKTSQYTAAEWFELYVETHNSQVDYLSGKYIEFCDVLEPDDYDSDTDTFENDYSSTWDAMSQWLEDWNAEMQVTRNDIGEISLTVAPENSFVSEDTIEFRVNQISVAREVNASDIITRLYPFGKVISEGTSTDDDDDDKRRYTIASVNNNKKYIIDKDAEKVYGQISGFKIYDKIKSPSSLLKKAKSDLKKQRIFESITVKVLDLSYIDDTKDQIVIGWYYPVKNELLGINQKMRVVKKVTKRSEPYKPEITLGDKRRNVVQAYKNLRKTSMELSTRIDDIRSGVD